MANLKSISVFFPAYNNAGTIPTVIIRAFQTLAGVADEYEVIVVNDGSTDDTGQVLDEVAQHYPQLRVIHHAPPSGYGGVLRAGFAAAQKEWIFCADGDAQYNPRQLGLLAEAVKEGVDVVQGYKVRRREPLPLILFDLAYQYFVKYLLGLTIRDVDCNFRLMRRSIFDQVNLESTTSTIQLEMMKKIQDAGFRIVEAPVHHWRRQYGESKFFNVPRFTRTLAALIGWWWRLVVKKEHLRLEPVSRKTQYSV